MQKVNRKTIMPKQFKYFWILILLIVIVSGSGFAQDKESGKMQNEEIIRPENKPDGIGGYIKKRIIDENGNEITTISYPGKPPANYRAPKALVPNTAKTLTNFPAYDWSFGCTATSAAMIAAYYDNNGYPNLYTGPTNGGVAPLDNSSWGYTVINGEARALCPISASMNGLDGRSSRGHVDDYWIQYDNCNNDPYITNGWAQHSYESCTGDFMKTNQSAYSNCDGSTTLYYYPNGAAYSGTHSADGGYGFQLYLQSRGYTVTSRFNQAIYGYDGNTLGFTYAQYKQEIDNGYPVFIHVEGHTMVGYGYDDATNKVYLRDTWDYSSHEMTWGGSYAGMAQWGVTVVHMAAVTPSYTITTSSSPAAGGTTSGGGTYTQGQTAQVTAVTNPGYSFLNWTEGGIQVSTNAVYSFAVTANRVLVANFLANNYVVSLNSSPAGAGTISGAGTYSHGTSVLVQAAANPGYAFVNWTEGGVQVSINPNYTFTITSNRTLTANFISSTLTVSTSSNPPEGGSTTGSGTFNYGQPDTVKATPNSGYNFVNWTEGGTIVSTNANYGFTVSSNRNLVANFALITYSISTSSNPSSGGATIGSGSFTPGQVDTVKATANPGYEFTNWTENGAVVSTNANYIFTVTADRNLVANFTALIYTITTSSNPSAGGTTSGSGSFNYGQTDTVKAAANAGYTFVNWTENGIIVSTNPNYGFTVTAGRNLVANFSINSYIITTSSNPSAGGATLGSGTFNYGQTDTAKAFPNAGYSFLNWTENGSIVSVNPNFVFTVTSNRNLVANFSMNVFSISTNSNPPAGGTTSGNGNFTYGQPDTIKASANPGYTFVNWTEDGNVISVNPNFAFVVTANRSFTANFSVNVYSVSINSNPPDGGSTTGGGSFNYGQPDTVKATANAGYTFVNWTENGNVVSTNPSYGFIVTTNRALTANFSLNSYTITTNSNPTAGGITAGGGSFTYGQTDTVKAAAYPGYTFISWTENGSIVSTSANYSFAVTANRTLTANFSLNSYTISTSSNPPAGGTTTGSGSFTYGQADTVKATANTGYTFVNWTENGIIVSTNANYGFTVTANRNLVANFSINLYTVTTSSNPSEGGTTSGSGTFTFGQTDTVKATANTGYTFINWTENGIVVSANPFYVFTVTSNKNLTANFSINTYTITTNSNPPEGGTAAGGGTYTFGKTDTVKATANPSYSFINWMENGIVVSTSPVYIFTVTASRNLIANFTINSYNITALSSPTNGGTISGSGTYIHGQTAQLTANANTGFNFINWTDNEVIVSSDASYSFVVTSSRTLTANFAKKNYLVTTISSPADGGITSGGGQFYYGDSDTVKAVPNDGYRFLYWTENNIMVSTHQNYQFFVTGNRTLTANFAKTAFTVSVSCNPANGGTVSGGGSFLYGSADTVKAVPNSGFVFINWTENDVVVSTNPVYAFTVNSNRTFTANFAKLLLSTPAGGETLNTGTSYNITWSAVNVTNIKIEYSINNGSTWNVITPATPAVTSGYSWNVPNTPSLNCKIRITDTQNSNLFSVNTIPFTIINQAAYASLTLGNAVAGTGDSVIISLTGKTLSKIGAISLKIKYDPDKLAFGRILNEDAQIANVIAGGASGSASISWFGAAGADFADGKLLDLKFFFKGATDSVPVSFLVEDCSLMDIYGINIPVKYNNGFIAPKSKLTGRLLYANQAGTPLNQIKVYLKNPVSVIDSSETNAAGEFVFTNLQQGSYKLSFNITMPWRGVNATDALLIGRRSVYLATFDSLQDKSADVNLSGNINSTDAMQVMLRGVGLQNSFAAGDWIYEEPVFYYPGGDMQKTIYALASGDVNRSYNFTTAKNSAPKIITYTAKSLTKGEAVEIPVLLNNCAEIGAAFVSMNFDPSSIKITGITCSLTGMVYKLNEGSISFAWADVNPVTINKNEPLFTINAVLIKQASGINISALPECEFADKTGAPINGLFFSSTQALTGLPNKFELYTNYPNPFNPATTIKYSIAQDDYVTLEIYNTLGKEIKTLVCGLAKAGTYTINWLGDDNYGNKVSSGVYLYRLTSGNNTIVKKMNLLK